MLNSRIFSLSVLSDQNRIDVIVRSFVAGNGAAGSDIGKEVKGSAEGQVQRYMAFTNWSLVVLAARRISATRELTASGPFKATLFRLMLSIVSGRIEVLPSISCGVTSTGSHLIGA